MCLKDSFNVQNYCRLPHHLHWLGIRAVVGEPAELVIILVPALTTLRAKEGSRREFCDGVLKFPHAENFVHIGEALVLGEISCQITCKPAPQSHRQC